MKLYIHSHARYLSKPANGIAELKNELKSITDKPYRRINKFIYLSLIGAIKCGVDTKIDENTAVYLATNYGSISSTITSLSQLHTEKSLPMPLDFINTAANIGGFYIASHFGLISKNICISSDVDSFQKALKIAYIDIKSGEIQNALVGGVDETIEPLSEFCRYTPLDDSELLRDGSCWLFVSNNIDGAIGEIDFGHDMQSDFITYDVGYEGDMDNNSLELYKEHGYYGSYPAFVCSYFLDNFKGKTLRFGTNNNSFVLRAY